MSDSTLQREIEALRPATEGTLQQMAKGIPLMGRDPDGKAKMINVDENGNVKVQQSGKIVALCDEIVTWDGAAVERTVTVGMPESPVGKIMISVLPGGTALRLFGGYGRIDSVPLSGGDEYTIEIRFRGAPNQVTGAVIFELAANNFYTASIGVDNDGQLILWVSSGQVSTSPHPSVLDEEWHTVSLVANANTGVKVFLDGELIEDSTRIPRPLATENVFIGRHRSTSSRYFIGEVQEARIWGVERTQSEIQATLTGRLTGAESGLLAYYPLNEGGGDAISDVKGGPNGQLLGDDWEWITASEHDGIDYIVYLEGEIDNQVHPWYDGEAKPVAFPMSSGKTYGIFGPFQAFPGMDTGIVRLRASSPPTSDTTQRVIIRGVS